MATLLKSLTVHDFRNVEPGTTLRFREGFNVLLGKNATGKTTLLDLIAAACSLDFGTFAKEPFHLSFRLTAHGVHMDVDVANVRQRGVDDEAEDDESESLARRVAQGILSPRMTISVCKGKKTVLRTSIEDGKIAQQLEEKDDQERAVEASVLERPLLLSVLFASPKRPDEWIQKSMEVVTPFWRAPAAVRLDESLKFFDEFVTGPGAAIRAMASTGKRGRPRAFCTNAPEEFAPVASHQLEQDPDAATLQVRNTSLLRGLAQTMGFRSATMYAQRSEKSSPPGGPWIATYSPFRFEFERHDGSSVDHRWLSYGQKRLVAFYFWLSTYSEIVIADELVNGLHHAWIDGCVSALAGRQAFLTTQNPLLLDYLPFESEGEVAEAFVVCKSAMKNDSEQIHWQNIGERESNAFFRAYKTGIQHVSEILAARGLW